MRVYTYQFTFAAPATALQDKILVTKTLQDITIKAGLHKVGELEHAFQPQGLSIVHILSESHIAMHTWPEEAYAYITLSTCSPSQVTAEDLQAAIKTNLQATNIQVKTVEG